MIDTLRKIETGRFNRACAAIGLAFLILTIGGRYALNARRGIDQSQDFAQYYMGGLIALHGESDSLYPIPKPGALTNAGFQLSSDVRPRYLELAHQRGVGDFSMRFVQPPPAALLFAPLALLPYSLSHIIWEILLIFAAWGVARQAGKIHAICLGARTKWIGVLMLLICLSPQAHRWVRVGNLSVLMAWLIGYAVIEIARRDSPRAAVALVIGTLLKYALLALAPVLVAARRWRTLVWSITLGTAFLGFSLLVIGVEPYGVFFRDIAPTLGRTSLIGENQALYRFLLDIQKLDREDAMPHAMELAFRVFEVGLLLIILAMVLNSRMIRYGQWHLSSTAGGRADSDHALLVFPSALALVAWMLIFSPIFWEHYHAYLAPFWGWLLYEGSKSRGRQIAAISAIALAYLPSSVIAQQAHLPRLPEPAFSHLLWSAVIMLVMAVCALWRARSVQTKL